jgi:hypothetical protein
LFKTPAFLRREGRRKRKAGAKNEKAIIIIAVFPKRSIKKSPLIVGKAMFSMTIYCLKSNGL